MRIGTRELLCILAVLSLPPLYWWGIYRPLDAQQAQVVQEYESKKEKLDQLESAMKHIDDLGREIDRLNEALTVFEAKLPSEKDVDVILKEVTQLMMRHGLKGKTTKMDKPIKNARYSELPLKMLVRGHFEGFYSFLIEVERLSRLTQFPQMKLTKAKAGEEGEMEAEFTLSIFFETQPGSERIAGL